MHVEIFKQMKTALVLLVLLTILTGLIYPLAVTCISQVLFPWKANGSLIEYQGKLVGSQFIGQAFTAPNYFWGRPSATLPFPYNAENSSGANLAPSNPTLVNTIKKRAALLRQSDPRNPSVIPIDLVTASASGLDPEISPAAALYQVSRVAQLRGLTNTRLESLVRSLIKYRSLGILGEPTVNVLQLNLVLDSLVNSSSVFPNNKSTS